MKVTRVTLKNWKNFKSISVPVQDRLFIVGANASGKSNLMDSLRFLGQVATGGLQSAVDERGGLSSIRCLSARNFNHGWIEFSLDFEDGDDTWSYTLSISGEKAALRRPIVKQEIVTKNGKRLLDRPGSLDDEDPERLTQTDLEQVQANRDFRQIGEFLKSIRYLHLVPQVIRDSSRGSSLKDDPFGGDFLERVAITPERTQQHRLKSMNEALKIAVPQLRDLQLVRDSMGRPHLQGRYEHWRISDATQGEASFSDGTLRLIGLLWTLGEKGGSLLLLEEPELSLHSALVRQLPSMFSRASGKSKTQIFVSTHAPEILADEGLGLDEVLVLRPSAEGTIADLARDIADVKASVDAGLTIEEAVIVHTEPASASKLAFY